MRRLSERGHAGLISPKAGSSPESRPQDSDTYVRPPQPRDIYHCLVCGKEVSGPGQIHEVACSREFEERSR